MATDRFGNVYFTDNYNQRVRKVNSAGIITTVAGTGGIGYSGDGGPATAAMLNNPDGMCSDIYGNIYICDAPGNRIRKVTTAGIISTVVGNGTAGYSGDGGAATAATINTPLGVAFDGAGNLYIADNLNHVIRKVNTSGIISTVAGNGTAGFSGDGGPATAAEINSAGGLDVDASGNIYIADYLGERIRKVTPSGIISTIAGNGTAGFSGDGGPATAAHTNAPADIALDAAGNIYFADRNNDRVRRIIPDRIPQFTHGHADSISLCENSVASAVNSLLSISDLDAGQTETWTVSLSPAHGIVTGSGYAAIATGGIISPTGFLYTPTIGYTGTDVFAVVVNDGYAQDTIHVYVSIQPATATAIVGDTTICSGGIATMSDTASGGTWASSNTTIATVSATGIVYGVTSGIDTIIYTYSGSCGTLTAKHLITILPAPTIGTIFGTNILCVGGTSEFSDSSVFGTWGSSTSAIATVSASGSVLALAPGVDTITYSKTYLCGTVTAVAPITVLAVPIVGPIAGDTLLCLGTADTFNCTPAGGFFTSTNTSVGTMSGNVLIGVGAGNTTIAYTYTGTCGTFSTETVVHVEPAVTSAGTISGMPRICVGDSALYIDTVSGGLWHLKNAHATNIYNKIFGISAGIDTLEYIISNICSSVIAQFPIIISAAPTVGAILGPDTVCLGDTITLADSVSGGIWKSSDSTIANVIASGNIVGRDSGMATISYSIANSCGIADTTRTINVFSHYKCSKLAVETENPFLA
jgi:Bacterial Ig-like domain (group 2)